MELRHLHSFVAVAEELNFTRAAERLQVSQPPLSQQIKRLEKEVGEKLFERDTRHVELTAAGKAFLGEARRALAAAKAAPILARRAAKGQIGRVQLGFNGPGASEALLSIARELRSRHPEILLDLVGPLFSGEVVERIHRREVDAGLVRLPVDLSGLETREISSDQILMIVPEGHRLADQATISIPDLEDEPIVGLPSNRGSAAMTAINAAFMKYRMMPNLVQQAPDIHTVMILVGAGDGIGFALASASHLRVPGVRLIPIPDIPPLTLLLAWREGNRDPALHTMLALVTDGGIKRP